MWPRRLLGARRMLRSQSFVRSADADLQRREERAAAALSALGPKQQRQLSPAEAQAFYDRLLEDSEHRLHNRWGVQWRDKEVVNTHIMEFFRSHQPEDATRAHCIWQGLVCQERS